MAQGADTGGLQDARDHDIKQDKSGAEITQYVQHHEMRVIPIEEEAVQDDFHIDLGWRSWVSFFCFLFIAFSRHEAISNARHTSKKLD